MRALAARIEDSFATLVAVAVVVLPLSEIVVRRFFETGVPGSGPFTLHLTLWVGLLGAAIAARDGKLLSLATGSMLPEGAVRRIAQVAGNTFGVIVATVFAVGGMQLVDLYREVGNVIAVDVPVWAASLIFPVTFGLIAVRLAWRASSSWWGRVVAAAGMLVGFWIARSPEMFVDQSAWPWLAAVLVAAVLGAPIFAVLGGAALFLFLVQGSLPIVMLIKAYEQLTNETLPSIPLFTLAGFLLAEGRAPERLLRLFRGMFGWMPGGTAVVAAVLCAFFTTFTGGSGVTILALGGLLLPALLKEGYRERFSLGLITASGSLGLLLPPALPLMLYGIIATGIALEDLFIGGLLPGLLMIGLMAALGVREGLTSDSQRTPFRATEAWAALWAAKWEVLLPIVVLVSLLGGYATPVESAALAALYALIVQRFVHRDLPSAREVVRVTGECISLVGGVLIILAVAAGLTNYLIDAQVPDLLVAWTQANIESRLLFLLALNLFLIVVGCLMDIFSALVVIVPLIIPIAQVFDIHPVHLGIIFVANLELGYLTPPVGLNLFMSSYRFGKPVMEVARASMPMLLILALGVLLITYVPWLTLGLLQWLGRA
ncbi:MAG: TRAP transporter large permease subunit [Acidobacteria bacterium]|nr:TRAP transporter large permease subunit [Acidobacteriota bacterium]